MDDLGVCSMGAWKECVLFYCWVESSISFDCILLVNGGVFISLLIFYLIVLSVADWEALKSPTIIAGVSLSPFSSIHFCFTYFAALLSGAFTFAVCPRMKWSFFHYVTFLSCPSNFLCFEVYFISFCYNHSCFLWLFACYTFSCPYTFNLPLSLYLKEVYFRQLFLTCSANLCLLIGIFRPLTFNKSLIC